MDAHGDAGGLRGALRVLSRRRWLVVAVTVLTTVAAVAVALLQEVRYEATAEVAVESFQQAEDASLEEVILGDATVNTERRVMASRPVAQRVVEMRGLDVDPEEVLRRTAVNVVNDTRVLQVTVTSADAVDAAATANAFADAYLELRREQAVAALVSAQDTLLERREVLRGQVDDLEVQLAELDGQRGGAVTDERSSLRAQRDDLVARISQLAAEAGQVEADARLVRGGGRVLDPAIEPDEPVAPQPYRSAVLGLVLGLMFGVAAALVRDHFDDVVRDEDDAKRAIGDLPVLGRIPTGTGDQSRLVTLVDPSSPQAEAYRGLSTSVRFLLAADRSDDFAGTEDAARTSPGHSLLVTSPDPGDGKTSTAANLAVAVAGAGSSVVLVGTDMRRPKLRHRFGLPATAGLSDVLAGHCTVDEALVDVGVDGLSVLPAGTQPPNPSNLLASHRMRDLLVHLCARADLVVLDAPPVLAVADALEIAARADASLLVVRANSSRRRAMAQARERLAGVGASVAGVVVNDLDAKSAAYHYYAESGDEPDGHGTVEPLPVPGAARATAAARDRSVVDGEPEGADQGGASGLFTVGRRRG